MKSNLLKFCNLEWEEPQQGVKQKVFTDGKLRLRLLQFSDSFVEVNWCTKGHIGYVLSGEMQIDFDGNIKKFHEGDGLWIDGGESQKHKVIMKAGSIVELILFESAD